MNQYSNVELGGEQQEEEEVWGHKAVRKLHFNGNPVGCWNEVAKLGQAFPSLESLLLAECPLRELQAHHTANFPELRFLNVSSTLLDTWEDIDHLRLFAELGSLRITNCPLLEVRSLIFIIVYQKYIFLYYLIIYYSYFLARKNHLNIFFYIIFTYLYLLSAIRPSKMCKPIDDFR
jgi:hypothetical protein